MDVGITPDEAKKSAYEWTCCSANATRPDDKEAPPRSPGCRQAEHHQTSLSATIVLGEDWLQSAAELSEVGAKTLGVPVTTIPLSEFQGVLTADTDCVAFLTSGDDQTRAMRATERVKDLTPHMPLVIFSDPNRIDGWRLQASEAKSLTADQLFAAIISAYRQSLAFGGAEKRRVFLSYSRADARLRSDWADELIKIEGGCWIDVNMLEHGVDWSNAILDGIANAEYFVLLLTENTPPTTYCWKELDQARRHNIPVIVVAYDKSADMFLSSASNRDRKWRTIYAHWRADNRLMIVNEAADQASTIVIPASADEKENIQVSDIKSYVVDFIIMDKTDILENHVATTEMIGDKTWHDLAPEVSDYTIKRMLARSKMPLLQRWWDGSWLENHWLSFAHRNLPGWRRKGD